MRLEFSKAVCVGVYLYLRFFGINPHRVPSALTRDNEKPPVKVKISGVVDLTSVWLGILALDRQQCL